MDLRAVFGLVLIFAGVVLAAVALFGNPAAVSRFLSLPKQAPDWLRLLLAMLAAYAVGLQIVIRLGYDLPLLLSLHSDVVHVYPVVALALGSLLALFVQWRTGVLYGAVSLSLVLFMIVAGPA